MRKSIISFLIVGLLVSMFMPVQAVRAQGITFPAEMNKEFSPINIPPGGTSRLSVTIFNPNSIPLTNASWLDNLPAGVTIANPVNLTNSCNGTVTAAPGGTTFSLNGGTVPAQIGATPGSCTVSIDVTSSTPGNHINTIPAGSLTTAQGVTTTSPASATLRVGTIQPPTIGKSFSPATIFAGQTSRLTITIRNNDSSTTLTQATLTDNLPANVFLANPVSPTLTGCGAGATLAAVSGTNTVTLSNGTIAPNSTCTITVNVTSNVQGSHTNTIPAQALGNQQGLTNATPASAVLNVDLIRVTKAFSPATIPAGGTSTLTITLQNPTASPYTGVDLVDDLPSPLNVVGAPTSTCVPLVSITATLTRITLDGGTIPAGTPAAPGTCTITVQVMAPAGTPSGTYRNTIPAGNITNDQGVGPRGPVIGDIRVAGTEVTGRKTFNPSTITAGGSSRLRIEVTAPGDTDLTNFFINDPLPTGMSVSNSSPPATSGCGATPPLVFSPQPGNTSISLSSGLILAGQTCRIDVWVTSSTTGVHANTIPPGSIGNDQNRTVASSLTANLTVNAAGNLAIEIVKSFNPLFVGGGAPSTMSILLINPENTALTGIAFTDNMPNGMILSNPVNPNVGTCGGTITGTPGANTFSFSGGSLPAGGTCTLSLNATITVVGNLTNAIPAGAVTTNEGAVNPNPTDATLTNLGGAIVSKSFAPNPIAAGAVSILTITIINSGAITLTGMGLADNLPGGLVAAAAPAPVNGCGGTFTATPGAAAVQLTGGVLAGNSSCTIDVAVTGANPGVYDNTIPAGALITDPALNVTNLVPATASLTITGAPPPGGGGGGGNNITATTTTAASAFIIPVTGFAPGRETRLEDSAHAVYASTSLMIDIPVLKVQAPIVGVESTNGRWDVSWLQQVGWLSGSAYPTWKGNSLLTGHVVNADGKPGIFSKLKFLGVGEYVFVYNSGYRYTYQVVSNRFVMPNDSSVIKHEEKSYLTLITCEGYDEATGNYLRRVVVRAVLVDVAAVP